MRTASLFLVLLAVSVGASARADGIGSQEAPIVRGDPVPAEARLGTVALLRALNGDDDLSDLDPVTIPSRIVCSGTLITATTVLTAGHCVQACPGGDCLCGETGCVAIPSRSVRVGVGITNIASIWSAEVVRVEEIRLQDDYTEWESLDFVDCGGGRCPGFAPEANDIALLRLAEPVRTARPVAIYPESRIDELAGTTVGLAQGYGRALAPESEALLSQDSFDALLRGGTSPIARTTENELLTARGEENVAVCFGDSGGPLYVLEGDTTWVVGVASRLRGDARECFGGGVYALAPAYTDWIEANVTGTLPTPGTATRGCSASGTDPDRDGLVLFASFALFLAVRRRFAPIAAVLACALMLGCGDEGAANLCNERYDPDGVACDPDVVRADLRTAESVARDEVPESAWLWRVRSSIERMDPNGMAADWTLVYYLPNESDPPLGRATVVRVVGLAVEQVASAEVDVVCIPTRPIEPFDSRMIVQESIARIERSGVPVVIASADDLALTQNHRCSSSSIRLNGTSYRTADGFYFASFDENGEFLELRPPD